jgi:hypothetical protein
VVRALDGTTISEGSFEHLYRFRGGLIVRMDIRTWKRFPAKIILMPNQPAPETELLRAAYARDIDAALALMTPDVEWRGRSKGASSTDRKKSAPTGQSNGAKLVRMWNRLLSTKRTPGKYWRSSG